MQNSEFEDYLKSKDLRITRPRLEIFKSLYKTDKPLSIVEIIKDNPELDKVTIYRTIETFTSSGVILPVINGWKSKYELSDKFKDHHHHFTCTKCGRVLDINSPKLESAISSIEDLLDAKVNFHHIELHGLCSNCKV